MPAAAHTKQVATALHVEPERIRRCGLPAAFPITPGLTCANMLGCSWWSTGDRGCPDEPLTNGRRGPSPATGGCPGPSRRPGPARSWCDVGATSAETSTNDSKLPLAAHHGSPCGGRRGGTAPPIPEVCPPGEGVALTTTRSSGRPRPRPDQRTGSGADQRRRPPAFGRAGRTTPRRVPLP
jgi:hypothetical protein